MSEVEIKIKIYIDPLKPYYIKYKVNTIDPPYNDELDALEKVISLIGTAKKDLIQGELNKQ